MKVKTVKNNTDNGLAKSKNKKLNKKVKEEPIVESDEEESQEEDIEDEIENTDEVEEDEDAGDGSSDEDEADKDAGDDADEKKTNGVTNGKKLTKGERRKELASKTITISHLRKDITKSTILEKFQKFGEIKKLYINHQGTRNSATIIFADVHAANEAKQLDGSIYYGITIHIFVHSDEEQPMITNPERTITLFNKQKLSSLTDKQAEALKTAFGPTDKIVILCTKNVLGFVTLKKEKQLNKALLLNDTTVGDLELGIEVYKPQEKARCIVVENLERDISEDDLRAHFKDCGDITFVKRLTPLKAQIAFDNEEAFSKSFALEETKLKGQTIFITPNSIARGAYFKKQNNAKKRAAPRSFEGQKKRFKFNPKYKNKKNA